MTQSMGPAHRSEEGGAPEKPTPSPAEGRALLTSKLAEHGSERPITGGVQAWAKPLLGGESVEGPEPRDPRSWDIGNGGAGLGSGLGAMRGPARAGKGQEGAGGQVRAGPVVPEGEACLAMATITQLQWTVSFLLPDLLPASEGRGPFFELQREQ